MIMTLETMLMKELTMAYVTVRLMHEMSKKKEKEPEDNNAAMVLHQGQSGNLS